MRPSLSVLTLVVTGLVVSLYGIPLAVMFIVSPLSSLQRDPFAPLFILVSAVGLGILWLALRVARRHREPARRLLALPLVVSWPGDSGKSGTDGRRAGEHPLVRFARFVCRQGNTPPGEPAARPASLSELLAADTPDTAPGADG